MRQARGASWETVLNPGDSLQGVQLVLHFDEQWANVQHWTEIDKCLYAAANNY